jgi:hypothetical protein
VSSAQLPQFSVQGLTKQLLFLSCAMREHLQIQVELHFSTLIICRGEAIGISQAKSKTNICRGLRAIHVLHTAKFPWIPGCKSSMKKFAVGGDLS